jgi:chromosome partitioning protein
MGTMTETCSVCGTGFEVQFRYQMEDREGGFSFYCSQKCLEVSQLAGGDGLVTCDACAKRFNVDLVSQVLYVEGRRKYACSMQCRTQVLDEARGVRLGDMENQPIEACVPVVDEPPVVEVVPEQPLASAPRAVSSTAVAVPVVPILRGNAPVQAAKVQTESGLPRFLAIFNHKGGTGKTTTSVSIAAGLAAQGKKVLLVDTDSQGNVAVSLNVNSDKSLYHVLVMGLPVKSVCQTVRENLDLVASNETLAAAELYLAGRQNRDRVLRDRLINAAQAYDYVLLDCSPSLSLMNQNALVFADSVLVPVACDFLSLAGVRQVLKTVRNVNQLLHHPVRIWGVLPTFYDARANICRNAVETMQQHFGERCLPPIRQAIKVKEAPSEGKTIFEYAPGSAPAEDYRTVVERIMHGHQAQDFNTQAEAATAC